MANRAIGAIEVTNLGAAMAFFVDQLQFALVEHQPAADVAMIDINGALALLVGPDAGDVTSLLTASPARFKPGDTLPLFSGDLDARRAALVERGVTEADIVTRHWGDRVLNIQAPDGYTVALIEPAQHSPEETMALYAGAPDQLESAIAGLSETDLDRAPAHDGWTIRQIIHHIVDGDDMWAMVLKAALGKSGSAFRLDWYSTDNAWAETLDYAGRAIEHSLALFRANRAHVRQLIEHLPDAWERFVMFSRSEEQEPRRITAGEIVSIQARHALSHITELEELRRIPRC